MPGASAISGGPQGLTLKGWAVVQPNGIVLKNSSSMSGFARGGAGLYQFACGAGYGSICVLRPGANAASQIAMQGGTGDGSNWYVTTLVGGVATDMLFHVEIWG